MRDPVNLEEERLGAIACSLARVLRQVRDYQPQVRLDHHRPGVEAPDQASPPGDSGDTLEGGEERGGWCCNAMRKYQVITSWSAPRFRSPHPEGSCMAAQANMIPAYCPWCSAPLGEGESPDNETEE